MYILKLTALTLGYIFALNVDLVRSFYDWISWRDEAVGVRLSDAGGFVLWELQECVWQIEESVWTSRRMLVLLSGAEWWGHCFWELVTVPLYKSPVLLHSREIGGSGPLLITFFVRSLDGNSPMTQKNTSSY